MDDDQGCLVMIIAVVICVVVGLIAYQHGVNKGEATLARQIAEGTHKVEATTNAFGTMEWRVVEVEEGRME